MTLPVLAPPGPARRRLLRHGQDADRRELGQPLHALPLPARRDQRPRAAQGRRRLPPVQARHPRHPQLDQDHDGAVPRAERSRARGRGEGLVRGAGGADHLPGGRGAGAQARGGRPRGRDRLGRDQVRGAAARAAARDRAPALHAARGGGRLLHGARDRADLLRGGQDLLAPAVHRGARDRSGEELVLHRLDHRSAAARPGGTPGGDEPRSAALPRRRPPPLAGALLRAAAQRSAGPARAAS